MYIAYTLCKYQYFHEEKTNRILKTHSCPLYGTQSGHCGSIYIEDDIRKQFGFLFRYRILLQNLQNDQLFNKS